MMLLRDLTIWLVQAVLYGIAIAIAGLSAHLIGCSRAPLRSTN
jgi:hypothetical protein